MLNLRPSDILYFEELQRDYENTINYYNDLAEHMTEWKPAIDQNKHFLTKLGLENDIKEVIADSKNEITKNFIEYIIWHLQKEYGLSSLDSYTESKILNRYIQYRFTDYKGKYDDLHYNQIIKDVCNELNIEDFNDAEYKDLKERLNKKFHYYWEHEKFKISNSKIKVTDFGFSIYTNWNDTKVRLDDTSVKTYKDIMTALNMIHTGELKLPKEVETWLKNISGYENRKPNNEFYTTHKVNILGIESLRFYKNRNLDIKFSDEESKDKFIRVLRGDF